MDVNRVSRRYGTGDARGGGEAGEADDGQYIRLRYSTQFTAGGRTHTIEMEVPVPVGASAERREQLIREAEAHMEQLYRRVEARARGQRPPETAQRSAAPAQQAAPPSHQPQAPQPAQTPRPAVSDQRPPLPRPQQPAAASVAAGTTPAAHEGPQAISLQDRRAASPATQPGSTVQPAQAAARTGVSPELPAVAGIASTGGGTMKLSEFIQIIRENWGLAPKEAMDLLQVKSLNNMNYRDLLRQLEPLVEQAASSAEKPAAPVPSLPASPAPREQGHGQQSRPAPQQPAAAPRTTAPPPPRAAAPFQAQSPSQAPGHASQLQGPANIPVYPLSEGAVREPGRAYRFDEEEDELEEPEGEASENEAEEGSMSEAMARIKIDELRDMRGTAAANQGRLKVLHNLLDSQISDEQFQQLISRLWHISSDKQLKQDQVEALISWSKEDYFEDEVRAVLFVLNEQA